MATITKPSVSEQGSPGGLRVSYTPNGAKQFVVDPLELNYELQFPNSIPIYDTMRSQDGHIGSILMSFVQPIVAAKWDLLTDGCRPAVVKMVRSELGLMEVGKPRQRRRREGISWYEHIEQACETKLWAGFAPFEQVYEVSGPRPGQEDLGLSTIVHLRKLAPRLPRTITDIAVGRDGGLVSISQMHPEGQEDVVIPVKQLVMYTHRKEGADWTGRSVLRQAYKHWLMKDIFLKLDAQAAERNSMGIPVITYADESQKAEAEQNVQNLRAGATAGLALPVNAALELKGVSGGTTDLIPRIQYHDQEMSRSALAMFLDLGHDNGARSLGEVHLSVFLGAVQAVADTIAEVATEHIVRDLVEFNFGPDEPYPVITPGDLKSNMDLNPELLNTLVSAGVVIPDSTLEKYARNRFNLPEAKPDRAAGTPGGPPAPTPAQPGETPPEAAPESGNGPTQQGHDLAAAEGSHPVDPVREATRLMTRLIALAEEGHR
jgi:hypothetical protein